MTDATLTSITISNPAWRTAFNAIMRDLDGHAADYAGAVAALRADGCERPSSVLSRLYKIAERTAEGVRAVAPQQRHPEHCCCEPCLRAITTADV